METVKLRNINNDQYQKDQKKIEDLLIHECTFLNNGTVITRVPGGLIYSSHDIEKDFLINSVFVPYGVDSFEAAEINGEDLNKAHYQDHMNKLKEEIRSYCKGETNVPPGTFDFMFTIQQAQDLFQIINSGKMNRQMYYEDYIQSRIKPN